MTCGKIVEGGLHDLGLVLDRRFLQELKSGCVQAWQGGDISKQ